jgi:alpha-L-glutamate ligase-like protein
MKKAAVPTTKIIKIVRSIDELENFDFTSLPKSFVVKPVNGVEGGGILVVYNTDKKGDFVTAQGRAFTHDMLITYMQDIMEGKYSHSYMPDHVLFEERVRPHNKFRPYTYKGTPDIRVIVFRRVPIMAMVRWPTLESEGKANFAQGAVGSGIDLATGITTHSIKGSKKGQFTPIEFVPNSRERYSGFKIPYWDKILTYAIQASVASKIGFCAVDFLIDRDLGPLVVEMNARPGLSIQLANNDGMKWRLEHVKDIRIKSEAHAIRLAKDLFGGEVQEEIEAIAGKKLISVIQPITLFSKSGKKSVTVKAKVDTGAFYSSIDTQLARELGFGDAIKVFEQYNVPEILTSESEAKRLKESLNDELIAKHEDIVNTHHISNSNGHSFRIAVNMQGKIDEKSLDMEVNIKDRSQLKFPVIIGRRDLKEFLIDPEARSLKV